MRMNRKEKGPRHALLILTLLTRQHHSTFLHGGVVLLYRSSGGEGPRRAPFATLEAINCRGGVYAVGSIMLMQAATGESGMVSLYLYHWKLLHR